MVVDFLNALVDAISKHVMSKVSFGSVSVNLTGKWDNAGQVETTVKKTIFITMHTQLYMYPHIN